MYDRLEALASLREDFPVQKLTINLAGLTTLDVDEFNKSELVSIFRRHSNLHG